MSRPRPTTVPAHASTPEVSRGPGPQRRPRAPQIVRSTEWTGALVVSACLLLAPVGVAGCGNSVDNTANYIPTAGSAGGSGGTDAGTGSSDGVGGGDTTGPDSSTGGGTPTYEGPCNCLVPGMWFKFDSLGVTALDGQDHSVIGTLNPLWAADIDKHELNIMLEVMEANADEVVFRASNAARVDESGGVCVLESTYTELRHPRSGCTLERSDQGGINVYAGSLDVPKNCTTVLPVPHAIPVSKLETSSVLTPSCDRIESGTILSGIISQHELVNICTCLVLGSGLSETCGELDASYADAEDGTCTGCNDSYINLDELLQGFGPLAYAALTDAGEPAVGIEGFWTATRLDQSPPLCE